MDLLNPIFIIPVSTGPFFILAGLIMWYFPPKKINSLYGYRTSRSMKSQERWNFSQKYSAKELIIWGSFLTLSSGFGFLFELNEVLSVGIGLGLVILFTVIPIINTEKALKLKFGDSE